MPTYHDQVGMSLAKDSASLSLARDKVEHGLGLWPIHRALTATLGAGLILITGLTVAGLALLGFRGIKPQPELPIAIFFDVLKLAFSAVAGGGAAVALVMAYRRQRVAEAAQQHTEKVAQDSTHDATERRVTELYGKAVEQLGHIKAPVRLGGLYSLERLAQAHLEHRQTVSDVVCAYLRMPFRLPAEAKRHQAPPPSPSNAVNEPPDTLSEDAEALQELQVRLAAQRMLCRHLLPPPDSTPGDMATSPDTYWKGIHIDLTGAVLVDFDFSHCHPVNAEFRNARFSGEAHFSQAQFSGDADFSEAQFNGSAEFIAAQFNGSAEFIGAQFSDCADFGEASFSGDALFTEAQFSGCAEFGEARFGECADFRKTQFNGSALFKKSHFSGSALFHKANFAEHAMFGANFNGNARFDEAWFSKEPSFEGTHATYFKAQHVWPLHWYVSPPTMDPSIGELIRRD